MAEEEEPKRALRWTHAHLPLNVDELGADDIRLRKLGPAYFDVVFQPIVRLSDGSVFGDEALVRTRIKQYPHPGALFEAAAKQKSCGWLGRVIRDITFETARAVPLFINIHPHELHSRWLSRPDDPIAFHDQPVYVEITEVAALDYPELAQRVLQDLRSRLGAYIAVDDLGAGHSDIKRVMALQPDVVKLDLSLAQGIDTNADKQTFVRDTVKFCKDFGALVVAEGIERVEELRTMIDCGVTLGQGFLMAKPAYPTSEVFWPWRGGPSSPHRYHCPKV